MSVNDDKFIYSTESPYPGSASGPFITYVLAERGVTGWTSTPLSLPYLTPEMEEVILDLMPIFPAAFSQDLQTKIWIAEIPLTPDGPPERKFGLYRQTGLGPVELVANMGEGGIPIFWNGFADISDDGSRIVFNGKEALLPPDAARVSGESVYEWEGPGTLKILNVDNSDNLLSTCGATVPGANGMSATAEVVFITTPPCGGGTEKVYVWKKGPEATTDTTTEISESQCTRVDCNAPADVSFAAATRDGKTAYLTTSQQLTDDDEDSATDLYRYDVASGQLTLLSGGEAAAEGAVLKGHVYPSEDGSRVYFIATGKLDPSEPGTGEKLFLFDSSGLHLVTEASFPPERPEIQLSADGSRVVFVTTSKLRPEDTDEEPDVYLYDAGSETLTDSSKGPSGGNAPTGAAIYSPVENEALQSSGDYQPFYAIDGGGERVFFSTSEALVPEDHNESVDIYEWWEGQLGLISPGTDEHPSLFAGVSRDGTTVAFVTNASLLPADVDNGNRDYYVARIGSGFPEPEDEEEGCDVSLCPAPRRQPLVRPAPSSMSPLPPQRGKLRLVGLRSSHKGVVGRKTTVVAEVPSPGTVSATVWARARGKKVVLASGHARAASAGEVRIGLRLTAAGRRRSSAGIRKGHLTVTSGGATVSETVKVDLG